MRIVGTYNNALVPVLVDQYGQVLTTVSRIANGASNVRRISTADNNLVSLKGSATNLYAIKAINASAADRYLKFYNKATAPVLATDVPVLTIKIAAGVSLAESFASDIGVQFPLGLAMAITGGIADTDVVVCAIGDIYLTVFFG